MSTPVPTMISVPAGSVTLSGRRTRRRWTVEVGPCLLAEVPETQGLYARVTGGAPGDTAEEPLPAREVSWHDAVRFRNAPSVREGLTPAYAPDGDADGIAWNAAADGHRLPTEAEWEHACRAGTDGARYGPLDGIARYRAASGGRPRPVRGKRPNAWGLHDMLGSVWEWRWDLHDPEVYGTYRVLRGGGWFDEPWNCRAGVRRRSHPALVIDDVGLRPARTPAPPRVNSP